MRTWLDDDEITAGDRFIGAIEGALEVSAVIVFLVSPQSIESGWVREEYDAALALSHNGSRDIRLIPVLLRDAELPPFLSSRKPVDFRSADSFASGVERLIAGIRAHSSSRRPKVNRVCFISSEYPPRVYGGLGIHVDKLTAALTEHLAVDVLLPEPGPKEYRQTKTRVTPVRVPVQATYDDLTSWLRFARNVPSRIEREQHDIIHCHDWVTVLAGIKCKWSFGIPLVFHVHLPNRNPLCASIENLGLVAADLVTVNSEAVAVEIRDRKLPIRELTVVHNGVDTDLFRPAESWPADGGYVLFVGRLVEQKGVEYLLRAFPYVRDKFPDVRLKIVGDGEFRDWLEQLSKNLMVSSHVEFLGWLEQEDIASLYQAARVVVVPSVYEPFGMVALEAFSCKRPVVASRVGGLREIVIHDSAGFIAEPKDHLDLAQWLMTLLSDSELRQRMGEAGFARLSDEGYLWPAVAEHFIKLYERTVRESPRLDRPEEADGLIFDIQRFAPGGDKHGWKEFMMTIFNRRSQA